MGSGIPVWDKADDCCFGSGFFGCLLAGMAMAVDNLAAGLVAGLVADFAASLAVALAARDAISALASSSAFRTFAARIDAMLRRRSLGTTSVTARFLFTGFFLKLIIK